MSFFCFDLPYWHDDPTYFDVHIHIPFTHEPLFIHSDEQLPSICLFNGVSQYWPVYKLEQVHVNETFVVLEITEQIPPFWHIGL